MAGRTMAGLHYCLMRCMNVADAHRRNSRCPLHVVLLADRWQGPRPWGSAEHTLVDWPLLRRARHQSWLLWLLLLEMRRLARQHGGTPQGIVLIVVVLRKDACAHASRGRRSGLSGSDADCTLLWRLRRHLLCDQLCRQQRPCKGLTPQLLLLLLARRRLLCDRLSWPRRLRPRLHAIPALLHWMWDRLGGQTWLRTAALSRLGMPCDMLHWLRCWHLLHSSRSAVLLLLLLLLCRQLLCDRLSWQRRLCLRLHAIAMRLRWMLHRLGGRNCE